MPNQMTSARFHALYEAQSVAERVRDQAYATMEKHQLNSSEYTIYQHRADSAREVADGIGALIERNAGLNCREAQ